MRELDDLLSQTYRGRPVLVTGDTGFKGAWLCAWLLEMGAEPAGYALDPPTEPSLFEALGLAGRIDHRQGDVRDAAAVTSVIEQVRPAVIVHMAAQALVRPSYEDPVETFDTNIMGTVHVLEAVRRLRRPASVIIVTSDKCYEHGDDPRPHREGDPLGGHDPYSASKGSAEIVTAAWRRSFFPPADFDRHGVSLASVRAGNVIGGGDWARDRIVPDIMRALAAGRPVGVRNPRAIRPWQHVLDALSGYLWLGARLLGDAGPTLAGCWNFGPEPGSALSVQALTKRVLEARGDGRWEDLSEPNAPHEAAYLRLAIDKATSELGWRPAWTIDEAIEETVAWYRRAEQSADMYSFTAEQIRRYVDDARASGAIWTTGARSPSRC